VSTSKEPIDLRAVVQERLDQLTFLKPLSVKVIPHNRCPLVYEGAEGRFSQGARLNESVAIFLDWWGWGRHHGRYSFTVFEKGEGGWQLGWQLVQSRIEDINVAVAIAIHTLVARALPSAEVDA
jgi:hypothetical protein